MPVNVDKDREEYLAMWARVREIMASCKITDPATGAVELRWKEKE